MHSIHGVVPAASVALSETSVEEAVSQPEQRRVVWTTQPPPDRAGSRRPATGSSNRVVANSNLACSDGGARVDTGPQEHYRRLNPDVADGGIESDESTPRRTDQPCAGTLGVEGAIHPGQSQCDGAAADRSWTRKRRWSSIGRRAADQVEPRSDVLRTDFRSDDGSMAVVAPPRREGTWTIVSIPLAGPAMSGPIAQCLARRPAAGWWR